MAMFTPDLNPSAESADNNPYLAQLGYSGEISGYNQEEYSEYFNFNAYGASMGCNSTGPDCVFTFSGWKIDLDPATFTSNGPVQNLVTQQVLTVPACPAQKNCTLTPLTLDNTFQNLTGVAINATVAGQPTNWFMDDLELGWFDNSCNASLYRQTAPIMK